MNRELSSYDRDFLAGLRAGLRAHLPRAWPRGPHGRAAAVEGSLGTIIGGSTTQIQKNTIAPRGLGLPRGA